MHLRELAKKRGLRVVYKRIQAGVKPPYDIDGSNRSP